MKTAVLAKYNSDPFVCVREYLINNTNPTICPTSSNKLPYLMSTLYLCCTAVGGGVTALVRRVVAAVGDDDDDSVTTLLLLLLPLLPLLLTVILRE